MAFAERPVTGQSCGVASSEERRRQKLLTIQKREEMKDVLTTKFRDRYSGAGKQADEVSLSSGVIGREVDRFCGAASMTQANLQRLERRIAGQAQGKTPTECDMMSDYTISAYSVGTSSKSNGSRSARGQGPLSRMAAKGGLTPRGSARNMGEEAYAKDWMTGSLDWSTLDTYAGLLHQKDTEKQRASQQEVKERLRKDLDRQVKDVQFVKEKEKLQEKALIEAQEIKIKQYDEKEQSKTKAAREKALKEKLERDAQLQLVIANKQQERQQQSEEGEALISQIAEELDLERQRAELKKVKHMEATSRLKEENEAKISERKNVAKREKEVDVQLMGEYAKQLDEEDEKRAAQLKARLDRQKLMNEKGGAGIVESERQKLVQEQKLIEQQRMQKDEAVVKLQQTKAEQSKQMRLETQREVEKQMQDKERQRQIDSSQRKQQAELLESDALDYLATEKDRMTSRRQRNFEHRTELERQIQSRVPAQRHCLSEAEVRMNKELLSLVSQTIQEGGAACG